MVYLLASPRRTARLQGSNRLMAHLRDNLRRTVHPLDNSFLMEHPLASSLHTVLLLVSHHLTALLNSMVHRSNPMELPKATTTVVHPLHLHLVNHQTHLSVPLDGMLSTTSTLSVGIM